MCAHHGVLVTFSADTALVKAYVSMNSVVIVFLTLVVKLFHGHHFITRVARYVTTDRVPDKEARIGIVMFAEEVLGAIVFRW